MLPVMRELRELIEWHETFSKRPDATDADEKIRRWVRESAPANDGLHMDIAKAAAEMQTRS